MWQSLSLHTPSLCILTVVITRERVMWQGERVIIMVKGALKNICVCRASCNSANQPVCLTAVLASQGRTAACVFLCCPTCKHEPTELVQLHDCSQLLELHLHSARTDTPANALHSRHRAQNSTLEALSTVVAIS